MKIFIFIFFRFGCPLYPLAQMETPRVGETNQGGIFLILRNISKYFVLQVHMIWPVLYILATVFITVVPMIAKPFETGQQSHYLKYSKIFQNINILNILSRYGLCHHPISGPCLFPLCLLEKQTKILQTGNK